VQYRINFAAATWRAEKANEILPALQDKFEAALLNGTLLELEQTTVAWVDDILEFEDAVA
jgi:hypothetical protein